MRAKRSKVKVCVNCGQPVRDIEGRVLLRGNAPSYRHAAPPVGCIIGDPLMERQVEER